MNSGETTLVIVLGAAVLGGLYLLTRPKKPIMGVVGGAGYLPGKQSATVAGLAALGAVGSKAIDYFITKDSDETKLAIAKLDSEDSSDD